jgi:hypothetical protein
MVEDPRRQRAEAVFERLSPFPGDGLRNHCLRIYRFADLTLRAAELQLDDGLIYLLALLHDLGLVCDRHGGDNYLERTRNLFRHEAADLELSARELRLSDECLLYNHRVLPPRDLSPEAAAFRRAVWIEHSRGAVRFGLDPTDVATIKKELPQDNFERVLLDFTRRVVLSEPHTLVRGIFF